MHDKGIYVTEGMLTTILFFLYKNKESLLDDSRSFFEFFFLVGMR